LNWLPRTPFENTTVLILFYLPYQIEGLNLENGDMKNADEWRPLTFILVNNCIQFILYLMSFTMMISHFRRLPIRPDWVVDTVTIWNLKQQQNWIDYPESHLKILKCWFYSTSPTRSKDKLENGDRSADEWRLVGCNTGKLHTFNSIFDINVICYDDFTFAVYPSDQIGVLKLWLSEDMTWL